MSARQPLTDEFLTATELRMLTGTADPDAQQLVLKEQGIPFRVVGGRVIVSRHHTREWLVGRPATRGTGVNLAIVR